MEIAHAIREVKLLPSPALKSPRSKTVFLQKWNFQRPVLTSALSQTYPTKISCGAGYPFFSEGR